MAEALSLRKALQDAAGWTRIWAESDSIELIQSILDPDTDAGIFPAIQPIITDIRHMSDFGSLSVAVHSRHLIKFSTTANCLKKLLFGIVYINNTNNFSVKPFEDRASKSLLALLS